jgi:hypothetical protein
MDGLNLNSHGVQFMPVDGLVYISGLTYLLYCACILVWPTDLRGLTTP